MTTNPLGPCFVSYRRTQSDEVKGFVEALHEHGIPTWQDVTDLAREPTIEGLRETLRDPTTAGTLFWLTPDIASSATVLRVEMPETFDRYDRRDGFLVVPIAAGGLDFAAAERLAEEGSRARSFRGWNIERIGADPASVQEYAAACRVILAHRLRTIQQLRPMGPLLASFSTFEAPPKTSDRVLRIDWHHRFADRSSTQESWRTLQGALRSVSAVVAQECPGRSLEFAGRPSLSAAFVLGAAFLEPRGTPLTWIQESASRPSQRWSLQTQPTASGFEIKRIEHEASNRNVALLLSISADVEAAYGNFRAQNPMAIALKVHHSAGPQTHLTPAQGVQLARETIVRVREVVRDYNANRVHFFMAAPVGFATIIGQLSNTLPPIQLYELDAAGPSGPRYVPSTVVPLPSDDAGEPAAKRGLLARLFKR